MVIVPETLSDVVDELRKRLSSTFNLLVFDQPGKKAVKTFPLLKLGAKGIFYDAVSLTIDVEGHTPLTFSVEDTEVDFSDIVEFRQSGPVPQSVIAFVPAG
jgi:hypothetical protein